MNTTAPLWPPHLPRTLDYPELTIGEICAGAIQHYGNRVALRDGSRTLTYIQMYAAASQIARGLRARGVHEGDPVILHLPNSLYFFPVYYGILFSGGVVAPTNPLTPGPDLRSQISEIQAVAAITDQAGVETVSRASSGTSVRTIVVVSDADAGAGEGTQIPGTVSLQEFIEDHEPTTPATRTSPHDVAHLAYTGGTTGRPKAVQVLHRNVVANVSQMAGWRGGHRLVADPSRIYRLDPIPGAAGPGLTPGAAVTIVVSPMFHAHALINGNFLLANGTTLVLMGRFEPGRMFDLIEEHRATFITGSPAMWHKLVGSSQVSARNLESLKAVSSGAAPIDAPTMTALARLFPNAVVVEGYGLTEATCLVSAGSTNLAVPQKPGSVGLPVFDTQVEIRALDGSGELLPRGARGALWVRGPQVTRGYLNRPDATAEQFVDGWLNTGDIAYLDDEGFLFLCDRAKDMLIYKGYNVYPRELEDVLVDHEGIDEAAVIGQKVAGVGEEPVAFVKVAPGRYLDPNEVMAYVAERVLPYKRIRAVHIVDALPSNAAGKILKTELRASLDKIENSKRAI